MYPDHSVTAKQCDCYTDSYTSGFRRRNKLSLCSKEITIPEMLKATGHITKGNIFF